jgi:hypothetical protein
MGNWCRDPSFHDLGTSWRWVISFTPGERAPNPLWIVDWVGSRASLDDTEKGKFLTIPGLQLRFLGRPARSQSLYRLHYPGSVIDKELWEELVAYFPSIRHGSHRKWCLQQLFFVAGTCLPNRCLAAIRGVNGHTRRPSFVATRTASRPTNLLLLRVFVAAGISHGQIYRFSFDTIQTASRLTELLLLRVFVAAWCLPSRC